MGEVGVGFVGWYSVGSFCGRRDITATCRIGMVRRMAVRTCTGRRRVWNGERKVATGKGVVGTVCSAGVLSFPGWRRLGSLILYVVLAVLGAVSAAVLRKRRKIRIKLEAMQEEERRKEDMERRRKEKDIIRATTNRNAIWDRLEADMSMEQNLVQEIECVNERIAASKLSELVVSKQKSKQHKSDLHYETWRRHQDINT